MDEQTGAGELRNYKCKDDELVVICRFVMFSVNRDKADFTAYSPMFGEEYFNLFGNKITKATELLIPNVENAFMKANTEQLHEAMNGLLEPLSRIAGYVDIARETTRVSRADFGITPLRERIHASDAEGTMKYLRLIIANIERYKGALTKAGLSEELIGDLDTALKVINTHNQRQYEIFEHRRSIVQDNRNMLNDLYATLAEICKIGKILYRNNPVKKSEYTFTELKKRIKGM